MSNVSGRYARVTTGEKELGNAFNNRASDPSLTKNLAEKEHWNFSPPAAPYFGGVWERLVQPSKRTIKASCPERANVVRRGSGDCVR